MPVVAAAAVMVVAAAAMMVVVVVVDPVKVIRERVDLSLSLSVTRGCWVAMVVVVADLFSQEKTAK